MRLNTKQITYIGIFSALVFIATYINVILPFAPQGGLVHFGTSVSVIALIVGGKRIGIYAGVIGMTMFDILGGWLIWAPATLLARLTFGYIMAQIAQSNNRDFNSLLYNILGLIVGGFCLIIIYYGYEVIIYKNYVLALNSILANVLQVVLAGLTGIPLGMFLKKYLIIK